MLNLKYTLSLHDALPIFGVLGANGAGKSSLLKIMAGLDDGFSGEARLTPGFTSGYLAQEPQLDPSKDVLGNVMDGVRSEEHTSEPSHMSISYAVFCLKKK